jgi:hypothetical protein
MVRLILAVVGAATVYEALFALGVIKPRTVPGEGPPGAGAVLAIAEFAILVGAFVAVWIAGNGRGAPFAALLAPAAAAFLVARYNTYDDYYLPTLRRASDDGLLPPELVYGLAALAVGTGLLAAARPRVGLTLAAPTMLACGLFAWVAFAGH